MKFVEKSFSPGELNRLRKLSFRELLELFMINIPRELDGMIAQSSKRGVGRDRSVGVGLGSRSKERSEKRITTGPARSLSPVACFSSRETSNRRRELVVERSECACVGALNYDIARSTESILKLGTLVKG